jgi:hypothetical protein
VRARASALARLFRRSGGSGVPSSSCSPWSLRARATSRLRPPFPPPTRATPPPRRRLGFWENPKKGFFAPGISAKSGDFFSEQHFSGENVFLRSSLLKNSS